MRPAHSAQWFQPLSSIRLQEYGGSSPAARPSAFYDAQRRFAVFIIFAYGNMEYAYNCRYCQEDLVIEEEEAQTVAPDIEEPSLRARRTAERMHGWTSPPKCKGMICPSCLTSKGAQGALFTFERAQNRPT